MRFHVPQFIKKETKLLGPLTLRQFLWAVGGGVLFLIVQFFLIGTPLIIAGIAIAGLTIGMAYGSIDGVSFPQYVGLAINFMLGDKKYTFQKEDGNK